MTSEGRRRAVQVAAFVMILVVGDIAVGSLLAGLGPHADPRSSPIGLLEAVAKNTEAGVLVLGSSRANHHMDSALLGARLGVPVHNAGLDGQSVVFARAVQEFAWDRGLSPDLFILQVDAFDVIAYEPARALVVTHYIGSMPSTRKTLEREGYQVRVKLLSRSYRFNSLVVQLLLNRLAGGVESGGDSYEALDGSMVGIARRVRGIPGRWAGTPTREVSPKALQVIRDFVRAATEVGSTAVLVTGPFLREGPMRPAERAALDAIADVAEAEGGILIEIDERTETAFTDPALFSDPSHLNGTGAEIYSDLLADLILESPRLQTLGFGRQDDTSTGEDR